MNQFDNYELTTLDYTLKYYLEHNQNLDDEDIEWCNIVRNKIDTIIESQAKYDMETVNYCHIPYSIVVRYPL